MMTPPFSIRAKPSFTACELLLSPFDVPLACVGSDEAIVEVRYLLLVDKVTDALMYNVYRTCYNARLYVDRIGTKFLLCRRAAGRFYILGSAVSRSGEDECLNIVVSAWNAVRL
jgi:hypothetical protein